ncbi:unnamed protein product [Cunninghamella echinulata]
MSNTVSDMQLFLLGLHDKNAFSCKNLEQLSSLWAAFTKCKQNIRDGFRLENMSWRLWYREAMMKKRLNTTTSIILPTPSTTLLDTTTTFNNNNHTIQQQPIKKPLSTQLVRTQSLPSLSHQNNMLSKYKKIDSLPVTRRSSATSSEPLLPLPSSSTASSIKQSKFYIDYNEDEEEEEEEEEDIFDYDDDTHSLSSNDSSIASYNDHPPLIQSKQQPISLLSHLLRKESSSQQSISNHDNNTNGLRRCQGYGKLDKWFLSAAAVSS